VSYKLQCNQKLIEALPGGAEAAKTVMEETQKSTHETLTAVVGLF